MVADETEDLPPSEWTREIVRQGRWLYDGTVFQPVTIVRLNYDFWYEIVRADGLGEPGDEPELNAEGFQYYLCFQSDPTAHPGWVDSVGFDSVEAASQWANSKVPSPIEWANLPVGP